MRTESDWPAKQGMGGHFHRLSLNLTAPPPKPAQKSSLLPAQKRGEISDWILDHLSLEQRHLDHLSGPQRRLSNHQVERRRYRSWPSRERRAELAGWAVKEFGTRMREYPGFHLDRGGCPAFAGPEGLLLPVADQDNHIVGFQIRPDDMAIGKRLWLSSEGRRVGTGSKAPAHISFAGYFQDRFTAYVVEGVLSADICSDILGATCVGLSGYTNWRSVDWNRLIVARGVVNVVIALDQDGHEARVGTEEALLRDECSRFARSEIATWNGMLAKGFDDCLNAGLAFTTH